MQLLSKQLQTSENTYFTLENAFITDENMYIYQQMTKIETMNDKSHWIEHLLNQTDKSQFKRWAADITSHKYIQFELNLNHFYQRLIDYFLIK